jgi:hypothetical protein
MKPDDERKLLRFVLKRIDNPVQPVLASRWVMPASWLVILLLVGLFDYLGRHVSHWLAVFGFLCTGIGYAYVCIRVFAARAWPLLARHYDRASLQTRLSELES